MYIKFWTTNLFVIDPQRGISDFERTWNKIWSTHYPINGFRIIHNIAVVWYIIKHLLRIILQWNEDYPKRKPSFSMTKNNGYHRKTIGYRSPCIFLRSDFHGNLSTLNVTTPSYLGRFHAEIYVPGFAPFRPWNSANRPTMKFSSWTWCSIPPKVSSILKLVSYFSKVLRYGNIFAFFDFHRSSKIFRWHWGWVYMK